MAAPHPPLPSALGGATLAQMAQWVWATLGDDFPPDTNGIWQRGDGRTVRRLGVARVGSGAVAERAVEMGVDALLLHRPWRLGPLPCAVGVLAFHEALDERLTTGENPWLAARLGFRLGGGIGERRGRPLVSLAHSDEPLTVAEVLARLATELPPLRLWNERPPDQPVRTIALANAMRPALVAVAASRGAALYLTGTLRPPAQPMLMQSQMAAVELGHAATEQWGLRWLAGALGARFGVALAWLDGEG